MFCIKCGAKVVEGAKFCQKCGAPVDTSLSASLDMPARLSVAKPDRNPSTMPTMPEVPQSTLADQSGEKKQANVPAANAIHSSSDPLAPTSPADPQVPGPAKKAPAGYPGFTPSPVHPKKKGVRWPWVVCGIGIAAVVIVVLAILGSTLGHSPASSESPEPADSTEPSSSQVREVSLTETYANEDEGFSFQYPRGWKPVAQEDMDDYAGLAETESTLVLLANENEDIPEANSYIMVSRYDADEGDEELLALDDEAFLEEIQIDGSHVEAASLTIDGVPVKEITCTVDESNLYRRTYYYVANQGFFRVDMLCSVPQSSEFIRFFDAVMDSYTITVFPEPTEEPALSPTQYIQMVTGGYRIDDPEFTYGDAFNSFFSSPHWEFFISEDDEKIVEFTGDCTYRDTPVTACIQFVIYEEDETFEAVWLDFNEVPQDTITMNALISTAFEELEEAVYGPANEWAASEHSYMRENDLYAAITFYPDGTFSMVANLYEGLGNVYGTYTVLDDRLSCVVDSRDFGGFVGDDVQEFEMIFAGDNLQYSGSQIGTCVDGSIYTPS